jgi:hypothetical protein
MRLFLELFTLVTSALLGLIIGCLLYDISSRIRHSASRLYCHLTRRFRKPVPPSNTFIPCLWQEEIIAAYSAKLTTNKQLTGANEKLGTKLKESL